MKIFDYIQLKSSESVCQNCAHFQNDPAIIEKTYPGLAIMSSGFASVRDQDGICNFNQLYLSARDSCPQFVVYRTEFNQEEEGKNNCHPK
jgi:hypothetical protein